MMVAEVKLALKVALATALSDRLRLQRIFLIYKSIKIWVTLMSDMLTSEITSYQDILSAGVHRREMVIIAMCFMITF
jgi:hypothetical protein